MTGCAMSAVLLIQRALVERLAFHSEQQNAKWGTLKFGVLFVFAYAFLLRLPSEALPVITCTKESAGESQSTVYFDEDEGCVVLHLKSRKNRRQGSVLRRTCWCRVRVRRSMSCLHDSLLKQASRATCPVHVVGTVIKKLGPGKQMFKGVTANAALSKLRIMLCELGVAKAVEYGTHDLRRGHAMDLQAAGSSGLCLVLQSKHSAVASGAPLYQILQAGEWSSPAFLSYLDINSLEAQAVLQAHVDESGSDTETE